MKKTTYHENKNLIHAKLKLFRVKRGMTQGELAARLKEMNVKIDQQMVSKIEHNMRMVTDYELACICHVLRVGIRELLADFYQEIEA